MNVKQRLGRQFDFRVWNTSVRLTDVSIPEPCEKGDGLVAGDGRERRIVWQEGSELGKLNAVVFDGVGAFIGCSLEEHPFDGLRQGEVFSEHCGLLAAVEFRSTLNSIPSMGKQRF